MHRAVWTLPVLLLACGKKPVEAAAPIVGWHQAEGWSAACYHPPAFAEMGGGDRRIARAQALTAIVGQWRGERGDGIEFGKIPVENLETVLLGAIEKVDGVALDNLKFCRQAMAGKGTSGWTDWLAAAPALLTAGECRRPLDVTMYNYLDLGVGWQFGAEMCEDDVIQITASSNDYYRVTDSGPWINADGDPDLPAGTKYPCNVEGCFVGQLILRFKGVSGIEFIRPIGTQFVFDPPEHGEISVMVNDVEVFDNAFKVERGVQHHTSITYKPAAP